MKRFEDESDNDYTKRKKVKHSRNIMGKGMRIINYMDEDYDEDYDEYFLDLDDETDLDDENSKNFRR